MPDPETFYVKQNDLLPLVEEILYDGNDVPLNLADPLIVVRFSLYGPGNTPAKKIDRALAFVVSGIDGYVRYTWAGTNTDTPGDFYREWEITYATGKPLTVPNGELGYPVKIQRQIA